MKRKCEAKQADTRLQRKNNAVVAQVEIQKEEKIEVTVRDCHIDILACLLSLFLSFPPALVIFFLR